MPNLITLSKYSIRKTPTRKIPTHQTPRLENSHPENSHPENPHLEYSHPRFYSCHSRHWFYLKDCFIILCFKSAEVRNSEVDVSKKLQLADPSLIIGHYYNPPVCFKWFYLWSFSWGMWCYKNSVNVMVRPEFWTELN